MATGMRLISKVRVKTPEGVQGRSCLPLRRLAAELFAAALRRGATVSNKPVNHVRTPKSDKRRSRSSFRRGGEKRDPKERQRESLKSGLHPLFRSSTTLHPPLTVERSSLLQKTSRHKLKKRLKIVLVLVIYGQFGKQPITRFNWKPHRQNEPQTINVRRRKTN